MIPDNLGYPATCVYCDSQEVYADKLQHIWCEECGQWIGWEDMGTAWILPRRPRWPGDWQGSDGSAWTGRCKIILRAMMEPPLPIEF